MNKKELTLIRTWFKRSNLICSDTKCAVCKPVLASFKALIIKMKGGCK